MGSGPKGWAMIGQFVIGADKRWMRGTIPIGVHQLHGLADKAQALMQRVIGFKSKTASERKSDASMPQNKKHHYVPKFYLKRFTPNERLINIYNLKAKRKILGASLSDQCYKDYMYGKDGQTEGALSQIEGEVSALFKKIDEIESLPKPMTEEHLTLLVHILIQHGRTMYATRRGR